MTDVAINEDKDEHKDEHKDKHEPENYINAPDTHTNTNTNMNKVHKIKIKRNTIVNFIIPTMNELKTASLKSYKLTELKQIGKFYRLSNYSKLKKADLIASLERLVKMEYFTVFIQKNIRRFNIQRFLDNKSPSKTWLPSKRKRLCKNDSDFYTLEAVEDIPLKQYICYVDENDCYWGFNMISLYNYFKHQYAISRSKNNINNPYTNLPFSNTFMDNFKHHIFVSEKYGFNIDLKISNGNEADDIANAQRLQDMLYNNIGIIEQHGYLLRGEWISSLSKERLIKFLYELNDIWEYRSQIDRATRRQICYPSGTPFGSLQSINVLNGENYEHVFKMALLVIQNFIAKGVTYSDCETGILYVLSALSLVSHDFANAYPWIYAQSHY